MHRFFLFGLILIGGSLLGCNNTSSVATNAEAKPSTMSTANSIYDFEMTDINGKSVPLSQFKGKKLMIVNVASKCGYTPQYTDLQQVYEQHQDKLLVLGFPANNFGGQEPGTDEQIAEFCQSNYGVSFPMFSKISVTGDEQHPLYQWLQAQTGEAPTWNFCKYVVSEDGKSVRFYSSGAKPGEIAEEVL